MGTNTEKKFVANEVTPVYPVHPGGILGEELKARGISQKKFAEDVGLQATHISALIHGARNFTPAVAAKIAEGLEGVPAELWMKLQERYNLEVRRSKHTAQLVSGFAAVGVAAPSACLAQPRTAYGGKIQVSLTLPESDKGLLEALAERLGWSWQ